MVRCLLDVDLWFDSDKAVLFKPLTEGLNAHELLYCTKTGVWAWGWVAGSGKEDSVFQLFTDVDAALWLIRNRCDLDVLPDGTKARMKEVMAELEV